MRRLRNAPLVIRRANDLIRASGLSVLSAEDPIVARKLKDLKGGRLLSPVLCVRGDLNGQAPMTIADGYHRICASYRVDVSADIPCRLAELPRDDETLSGATRIQGASRRST